MEFNILYMRNNDSMEEHPCEWRGKVKIPIRIQIQMPLLIPKTGVIYATSVVATNERSQNLRTGHTIILT